MIIRFVQTIAIVTVFVTLHFKAKTFTCICVKEDLPTLYNEFETTEYIFIGAVTNMTITWRYGGTGWSRDVQFHVDEYLKPSSSSVSNNNSIIIYTANERSACGLNMKLNQRWQVWATYTSFFSNDDEPRWLTADKCGRSTKIYNRNISLLRNGLWPSQFHRIRIPISMIFYNKHVFLYMICF